MSSAPNSGSALPRAHMEMQMPHATRAALLRRHPQHSYGWHARSGRSVGAPASLRRRCWERVCRLRFLVFSRTPSRPCSNEFFGAGRPSRESLQEEYSTVDWSPGDYKKEKLQSTRCHFGRQERASITTGGGNLFPILDLENVSTWNCYIETVRNATQFLEQCEASFAGLGRSPSHP